MTTGTHPVPQPRHVYPAPFPAVTVLVFPERPQAPEHPLVAEAKTTDIFVDHVPTHDDDDVKLARINLQDCGVGDKEVGRRRRK